MLCEVWYSLNTHELGAEYFEDNLAEYMNPFMHFLAYSNPLLDPTDQDEPGPLDNLKASICRCVGLWAKNYEEKFKDWVPKFVSSVWTLCTTVGDQGRFDSTVNNAVSFLTTVVKKVWNRELFANVDNLRTICERVVIPQIRLRQADIDLFDENGVEYVRRDMEGSDVDTRRRTTIDFVRGLRVQFNQEVSNILKTFVMHLLSEYAANPEEKWGSKDAAMYIIYALSIEGKTEAKGITAVNSTVDIVDFLGTQVLPELAKVDGQGRPDTKSLPILKADCLKFLSAFRSQLPRDQTLYLLSIISRFLASDNYVIHTYAASAVERLLGVKDPDFSNAAYQQQVQQGLARGLTESDVKNQVKPPEIPRVNEENIGPILQPLLEALFNVLQQEESKENEYVIKAIMRTCAVGRGAMQPFASILITKITTILGWVSENPRNPRFNHYLFETLACLIHYITMVNPSAVDGFEAQLFPPLQQMLGMEACAEFGPYVFLILAKLLGARTIFSQSYTQIFPSLLFPALWENSGNIPSLVNLLTVYIVKGFQIPPQNMTGLLGIFQKLNSNAKFDKYGLDLLNAIVENVPVAQYQHLLPEVLRLQFTRLQQRQTPQYCRSLSGFWSRFIIKHGADALISCMNTVQTNIFAMVLDKFYLPNVRAIGQPVQRKLCALALVRLLATTQAFLESPMREQWPVIVRTVVEVLVLPPTEAEVELDVLDESSKGFSTDAAKLAFAKPVLHDPCTDVKELNEVRLHLAQALGQVTAARPGVFRQMLEAGLTQDHIQALGAWLQSAAVTLQ